MNHVRDVAAFKLSSPRDERHLGRLIASFRRLRGLSVGAFADRLGVTRQSVWYWERGLRRPSQFTMHKLAELGFDAYRRSDDSVHFADVVDAAKARLAGELGISPDDIRIAVRGWLPGHAEPADQPAAVRQATASRQDRRE